MIDFNYEAEVSILGSIILEGALFTELVVNETHFHNLKHKKIYRAMYKVDQQRETIDFVTLTTALGDAINEVGGTTYLLKMAESVATTENIAHHQRLMLAAYRMKKAKEQAQIFMESASEEGLEQLISELNVCLEIGETDDEIDTYNHLVDISTDVTYPTIETPSCLSSYVELDEMTGGFQKGDLIIVAARPSVGKTAFALNVATGHCSNNGSTSIFSLEMGSKQLLHRMISSKALLHNQKWRTMAFNKEDLYNVIDAIGQISNWKLHLHEKIRTVSDIKAKLRKRVKDDPGGKHLAIIDYLQMITPMNRRERRDIEVGEITRELKLLALELDIPIILLSQLSRGVEQRNDKRPFMSDLRESGNIEQDADVIAFLYRDDYYNKDSDKSNIIEIILSKQRNGPTGTVELGFVKEFGRFVDMESGSVKTKVI
ncbi:replicative DNA helicase [Aquibacillus rhizosphaerae]|uniref:DNA 5'-3' helicase n=1 Tax=Aquibacillus rhizosphaerae TaxID=3051431 RepID=A0ABT7L9F9_9BACI|nr:replicative DNA helicase [Aquibacillus sp. LR5S19]MDL4842502.1 replicative DNA helicase [Aquibacillus sp. LR5S19]